MPQATVTFRSDQRTRDWVRFPVWAFTEPEVRLQYLTCLLAIRWGRDRLGSSL